MQTQGERRIEPAAEILGAAREWLGPVRTALGSDFLAAYLTGSVLNETFDARHSHVNLLVVARTLNVPVLERLTPVCRPGKKRPTIEPLFLGADQVRHSLDVFPIEWLEIQERHLLLEGEDVFAAIEVPRDFLRLQCEHELRAKHIRMRQTYLLAHDRPSELESTLRASASGFATLFRTLLRLRGETPPADTSRVVERVADLYRLDATGVLGPHVLRYDKRRRGGDEIIALYRKFLVELDRLVQAIDEMRVS